MQRVFDQGLVVYNPLGYEPVTFNFTRVDNAFFSRKNSGEAYGLVWGWRLVLKRSSDLRKLLGAS